MRQLSRFALAATFGAAILTGCRDATGPTIVRTYVLRALGSNVLPAPEGLSPDYLIVADTLRFRSDGIVTESIVRQWPDLTSGLPVKRFGTGKWRYRIDGTAVTFEVICGPNADCAMPPEGVLLDDTLDVSYRMSILPTYHYERIRP